MYCLVVLLTILLNPYTVSSQCGVLAGAKIVGGQEVPTFRFPWYVAFVSARGFPSLSVSCGGSLITSRHVLTAAHCFPSNTGLRPEQMYRAVFQLVNRCQQKNVASSTISKVNINPNFNPQTLKGDIAIATLQKAVSLTPICLPSPGVIVTGKASIIGFGSTLAKAKAQFPCVIQEAVVDALSERQCRSSGLSPEFSSIPGTFCAGVLRGGVDSCEGDSGGPLQTQNNNIYFIQGIVSFGEGCARRNLPGIYTQVSHYMDFIHKVTSRGSFATNSFIPFTDGFLSFLRERRSELYRDRVPLVVGLPLLLVVAVLLIAKLLQRQGHSLSCKRSCRDSSTGSSLEVDPPPAP